MCVNGEHTWQMMAILKTEIGQRMVEDNTLQFLGVLLFKVLLNCLLFASNFRRASSCFLGFFCVSLFLADLAMVCGVLAVQFSRDSELYLPELMCSILAHSSTMYQQLPLPVLLLGLLDYTINMHRHFHPLTPCRAGLYCTQVLLVWAYASWFSYNHSISILLEGSLADGRTAIFCPVLDCKAALYCCLAAALAAGAVLLFFWRELPLLCRVMHRLGLFHEELENLVHSKPPHRYSQLPEEGHGELGKCAEQVGQWQRPPLLLSITMGYTLSWMAFLLINIMCVLVDFAVPSYISVNILWTMCFNSLLTGLTFWARSQRTISSTDLPEDICNWTFYWHMSRKTSPTSLEQISTGIYTLSDKTHKNPSLV
ncbi:probable G-protein coupled receptor 160 [Amia ocellicauda]|uniref:probable G-protein coupled receptor 160 n=1 Tax=Amia ocellicauda TaxID=2972642 RepID=UPI003463B130